MSSLRDSLQAIYDERGGLTPRLVVDAARPAEHPLHSRFEWNDSAAGERWRLHQASKLIRSVKVIDNRDTAKPRPIREYVSVIRSAPTPVYVPTVEALADPVERQIVLRDMERDIAALTRKYAHLKEFAIAVIELLGNLPADIDEAS